MQNRRKHVRRDVSYPCWLGAESLSEPVLAQVRNISEGGAKVAIRSDREFPEQVDMYMTQDGKVGRRCKIVWRESDSMGLMFIAKSEPRTYSATVEI